MRLSKSEVEQFGREGFYTEITHFPNTQMEYGIVARHDISNLQAEFNEKGIFMLIPQHIADEWVATQRVGYDAQMPLPNQGGLYLLLEKDFQCLDATTEDQSDMYPNPLVGQHP